MTSFKEFVDGRLRTLGINPFEAARRAGAERTFVRDILVGRKTSVNSRNIEKLAIALDTTAEEIVRAMNPSGGGGVAIPPAGAHPASEARPAAVAVPDFAALPRDVPVYGSASGAIVSVPGRGGKAIEGFTLDRSKAIEFVRRPPALAGAPDVYAIYVAGDSMAPQHSAGDLRFVHPNRPPRGGDTVLIVVRSGEGLPLQAFLKRYIGQTPGGTSAEQINPPAVITFKPETVVGVHRVLTMNELFTG